MAHTSMPAVPRDKLGSEPDFEDLVDLLSRAARRHEHRELLRVGDGSWTYAQFDTWTSQLAHFLTEDRGVRPGDRVAIMLPNCARWPASWLAILKAGAVVVPVNSSYQAADLEYVLKDSGASVVLTSSEKHGLVEAVVRQAGLRTDVAIVDVLSLDVSNRSAVRPAATITPDTLANLQYTSGTTGFPKACMLTHDYWRRLGWINGCAAELSARDVVYTSQPFSYMDPQWNLVMCMIAGATLVVAPRFSASGFFRDVRRHEVTLLYVLGTMPALLYKQPPSALDRDHEVRLILCSGIPAAMHADLEKRWGAPWREGYGMTESGVDLLTYSEEVELVGSGLIGRPVPSKRVRVVDQDGNDVPDGTTGELISSGKPVMVGYWNRPEETARTLDDGWLHTGDLVQREPDGYFRIVGRLKDMVRRGGENISCAEVEGALLRNAEVVECAVIAVPDQLFGEEVKAFVRLADGNPADRNTAEKLRDSTRLVLARFKLPRYVEFVDGFPKTPSERIAKAPLKERRTLAPERSFDLQEPP